MAKPKATPTDPILAELVAIKQLMVFSLLRYGASQRDVAAALGVGQSQVSRMFPGGVGKSARGTGKEG